jgi:hypothetical protein
MGIGRIRTHRVSSSFAAQHLSLLTDSCSSLSHSHVESSQRYSHIPAAATLSLPDHKCNNDPKGLGLDSAESLNIQDSYSFLLMALSSPYESEYLLFNCNSAIRHQHLSLIIANNSDMFTHNTHLTTRSTSHPKPNVPVSADNNNNLVSNLAGSSAAPNEFSNLVKDASSLTLSSSASSSSSSLSSLSSSEALLSKSSSISSDAAVIPSGNV